MKNLIIIIIILSGFLPNFVFGENNIMFEKANQLYHNKSYEEAAQLYQQMIDDGYCDADLYYNAGNAYYRTNKIGLAIWNLEKALQLKKTKNYSDNLSLAQKRIKEPIASYKDIFFIKWWKAFTNLFTYNGWAILALSLFLINMIVLIGAKFTSKLIRLKRGTSTLIIPIVLVSLAMSLYQFNQQTKHYFAVIISPSEALNTKKILSEGVRVQYLKSGKKGVWVKLPNDEIVEIKASSLKKL